MTKPLALLYYIQLMPGSQLANRLHELGYRVLVVNELPGLDKVVEREKPIVLMMEIPPKAQNAVCEAISAIKTNPATQHLPVLAFSAETDKGLQAAVLKAGATLLASSAGIADQLASLLDHVLMVD